MKAMIQSLGRRLVRGFLSCGLDDLFTGQTETQSIQVMLRQQYKSLLAQPNLVLPTFGEVGFRQYSQFEEDGILLYLFSLIGTETKTCLEICAGDGIECNTANLIINHGWWGHLFDGNPENVAAGEKFYAANKNTFLYPPKFRQAWINAENVNDLISQSGLSGPIDLLSLDMDGVDYWIWKAIEVVEPRVVVCEIQGCIPADRALTVPYSPDFTARIDQDGFWGASLAAMTKLADAKGYRLVGVHRYGFNAFYLKRGILDHLLPAVSPMQCAIDPFTLQTVRERWPQVKDRDWVEV